MSECGREGEREHVQVLVCIRERACACVRVCVCVCVHDRRGGVGGGGGIERNRVNESARKAQERGWVGGEWCKFRHLFYMPHTHVESMLVVVLSISPRR